MQEPGERRGVAPPPLGGCQTPSTTGRKSSGLSCPPVQKSRTGGRGPGGGITTCPSPDWQGERVLAGRAAVVQLLEASFGAGTGAGRSGGVGHCGAATGVRRGVGTGGRGAGTGDCRGAGTGGGTAGDGEDGGGGRAGHRSGTGGRAGRGEGGGGLASRRAGTGGRGRGRRSEPAVGWDRTNLAFKSSMNCAVQNVGCASPTGVLARCRNQRAKRSVCFTAPLPVVTPPPLGGCQTLSTTGRKSSGLSVSPCSITRDGRKGARRRENDTSLAGLAGRAGADRKSSRGAAAGSRLGAGTGAGGLAGVGRRGGATGVLRGVGTGGRGAGTGDCRGTGTGGGTAGDG
nr:uncharacterized PE-PGRS family protein PE_PGRS46-like [Nerophis lumbriciformis]